MLQFRGWWEYYFLRYFVGTIVGAAAILASQHCQTAFDGLEWKQLAALAALGFAYCYIASAPLLTLHVIRAYLFKCHAEGHAEHRGLQRDSMFQVWSVTGAIVIACAAIVAIWQATHTGTPWRRLLETPTKIIGVVSFASVWAAQFISMKRAYQDNGTRIVAFYEKLSRERVATNRPEVHEYVESYRHMREHSNAYAILVFEILLAPFLFVSPPRYWLPIACFWLIPPACCWFVATGLEVRLANRR